VPAVGRSKGWRCACGARLAVIRGQYPRRRLQPALDVPLPQYREDGIVALHCPACGKDNYFAWRPPAPAAAEALT
jgi:hypothetical protein